ncbi:MAG: maleylpyruvate isomerase family mycothiol-dependent enzyme [Candidatus Nanopelagicales bacterium]
MTALVAESYDLRTLLSAWEDTLHAVVELGRRLSPEQWRTPTECPGWTAGDIVRHLSWVEAFLAGRQDPDHLVDWDAFPHVTSDFGRLTETGVDVRRPLGQQEACDELDGLIDLRLHQIMALDPLDLLTEVPGLFGRPVPLQNLLRVRVFDAWTHLQDIRRSAGLPGDLATAGAQVSALQMANAQAFVLSRNVEAPIGTTLRVTVTGPVALERWSLVDEEGRGVDLDALARPEEPTIGLTTDWETYARLGAGRLDVTDPDVLARLDLTGDEQLAAKVPESLAVTP